jgi:hypothetical protein
MVMRTAKRVLLFAALIALVGMCGFAFYIHELKRKADYLVGVSYRLSEGDNPPTVEEVRKQLGSSLKQPNPCTPEGCGYDVIISNRPLSVLHVAPYTALRSSYWAKNGIMQSNDINFWTLPYGVTVQIRYCSRCALFSAYPGDDRSEFIAHGSVDIDKGAAPSMKHRALSIDTGCLTKWHGCSGIAQLLPTVWQQTQEGTLHCRIPIRDGIFETIDPR